MSKPEIYQPTPTEIEWCDSVLNICVGCKNDCHIVMNCEKGKFKISYCYAKSMMRRFWEEFARNEQITDEETLNKMKHFLPVIYANRLKVKYPHSPKVIFVDSMSDWHYWTDEAKAVVYADVWENPQHKFVILTKNRQAYSELKEVELPGNLWLGYTLPTGNVLELEQYCISDQLKSAGCKHLLNLEPFWSSYIDVRLLRSFDAVIIGGMSGSKQLCEAYEKTFHPEIFFDLIDNLIRIEKPFYIKPNMAMYVYYEEYLENMSGMRDDGRAIFFEA